MKVGIIGGGVAGLSTALALKKANISFHLFEQASAFKDIGAGVMLSSSTKYLLHQLGVGNDFEKASTLIKDFNITNHHLQTIKRIPSNEIGYGIHRARLIEVLSKPLQQEDYTLNARIEKIEQNESGVTINANNTSHFFDIVVAADGVHSVIRNKFSPHIQPSYTGQIMWRGIATLNLPDKFKNAAHEMWGKNKRFNIIHKGGDDYFWFCIRWIKDGIFYEEENLKHFLHQEFKDFPEYAHAVIDADNNIIKTPLRHIKFNNLNNWYNNRIVFVGDCIHACTPDIAQGACQAIESAYTLAACLKKYPNNFKDAFELYQFKRKPKTKFINNASFAFSRFSHQRKKWQYNVLFSVFKLLPNSFLQKKFNKTNDIAYMNDLQL